MSALPGNMQGTSKEMVIEWFLGKLKKKKGQFSNLLKLIVAFNAEDFSDFSMPYLRSVQQVLSFSPLDLFL